MKIKYALLLSALASVVLTTEVTAKMLMTKSKGADAWGITTLDETTMLTKEEMAQEIKKNDIAPRNMDLEAYTKPETVKVGTNIVVHSYHEGCFQNVTSKTITYGVRFSLSCLGADIHYSENNFMLSTGQRRCFKHESFMNVYPLIVGKFKITAWTVGQENEQLNTITNEQPLTVTE
jgi:hypothetical protein